MAYLSDIYNIVTRVNVVVCVPAVVIIINVIIIPPL